MPNDLTSIYSREALRGDYSVSVEAYYLKDWQGYDMALHSHARMEIMYVVSGNCVIKTADGDIRLKKGEFILLDASVPHGLKVGKDACRIMNIEFTLAARGGRLPFRAVVEGFPAFKRMIADARPYIVLMDTADAYGVLRSVINCLDEAGEGGSLELEVLLAQLFIAIARLYGGGEGEKRAGLTHVRRAVQFMNQNYYREIGMKDISAHAGVAEGYLSRVFRRECGETVIAYLTKLRIKKAQMLLGKTELPIVEISGYVGVPSREYFNELFKKHTGMTPGEYRRACSRDRFSGYECSP